LILAVENHDRLRAAELVAIIRAVDCPRVGVCLDTVNNLGAAEGPAEVIRELAPLAVDLHLKDFTVRRHPTALGFVIEGTPAGEGRLDFAGLLGELRRAGRDPDAILELWTPPAADLEATIRREREWAERSLGFLRRLGAR
jgi:sugar phosphate isomerase/epimerase